ncbi:MAG TPA: 4Fe-4S binding protein, partial [Bacteroidales bacterium]|nr:4Fe-4S binding protein [Bacteroidales bacterium]
MAKVKGSIVVDIEKCKGCELCVVTCPTKTIALAAEV